MDISGLIPKNYRYYVESFTRSKYPKAYEAYKSEMAGLFAVLGSYEGNMDELAEKLMDRADSFIKGFFGKKLALFDIKQLLFVYLLPAAYERGGKLSSDFIPAVQRAWERRREGDRLNFMTYSQLCGSFNKTIMGFEFGGK